MNWLNPLIVQQLGLTLLHFIWQGLLVGLLYGSTLVLLRPARAATRYNLAVATLVVLALLPVLTFGWLSRQAAASSAEAAAPLGTEFMSLVLASSQATLGASPLVWVVALWLSGVLLLSLRLMLGWHYLLRLRRMADHLAAAPLQATLNRLKNQLGINRVVGLAVSHQVHSPVVIGWLKPLVLFPPALLSRLPMDQIEMVLAHELAHIRRHDHLVNLFQTVVETLLFYHPVVAWVSRRIRIERENACDDLAVDATGKRLAYVEMLAALEQFRRPGLRLALGVQDGQILVRIRRLVERARPTRQRGVTLPAVLLVSLLAGSTGLYLMPEKHAEPGNGPASEQAPAPQAAAASETPAAAEGPAPSPIEAINAIEQFEPIQALEPLEPIAQASEPEAVNRPAASGEQARPSAAETASVPTAPLPPEPADSSATEPGGSATSAGTDPAAGQAAAAEPAITPTPVPEIASNPAAEPFEMAALGALPERRETVQEATPEPRVALTPPPITGGALLDKVEPEFPARARQRDARGLVELEFLVSRDGQVSDIEVIEESPANRDFAEAAVEAVAQWRFEPFRQGEALIDRRVRLAVEFGPYQGCVEMLGSRIPRC